MLKKLYIFLFIISFYFIINTPKKHYDYSNDDQWISKLYLVYGAVFILFIAIFFVAASTPKRHKIMVLVHSRRRGWTRIKISSNFD